MHHVIHDSDEEEELELPNSEDERGGALKDPPHASPDELGGPPGTSSTDKLLKEAQARMMQGNSPRPDSPKRKRPAAHQADTLSTRRLADRMGQEESVWDVPGSPARQKADHSPPADPRARRLTSSEIRRKYEGTPTEAATSSTSNPEKTLIDLSRSTLDSGVSFDGPGPGVKIDNDVRGRANTSTQDTNNGSLRRDSPRVLIGQRETHDDSGQLPESPSNARAAKRRPNKDSNAQSDDGPGELLDSDELEIGLPKEKYIPRPSRRRNAASGRVTTQAAGFDGSDEISLGLQPRSSKRRKTEGFDDTVTEDGVARLVEMGFSPDKARNCIREVDGNLEKATEMLLQSSPRKEEHGDDLTSTMEADSREILASTHEAEPIDAVSICSAATSPTKSPHCSKAKKTPAKKKRGRPPKKKPLASSELAQYTDSQIHGGEDLGDAVAAAEAIPSIDERANPEQRDSLPKQSGRGRGRGRPRKGGQSAITREAVNEEKDKAVGNPDELEATAGETQAAIDTHAGDSTELGPEAETKASQDDDKENMPVPEEQVGHVAEKSASSPATAKPSKLEPASTTSGGPASRVPYRVGLSKRVRMPSLLRVVKKPQ